MILYSRVESDQITSYPLPVCTAAQETEEFVIMQHYWKVLLQNPDSNHSNSYYRSNEKYRPRSNAQKLDVKAKF